MREGPTTQRRTLAPYRITPGSDTLTQEMPTRPHYVRQAAQAAAPEGKAQMITRRKQQAEQLLREIEAQKAIALQRGDTDALGQLQMAERRVMGGAEYHYDPTTRQVRAGMAESRPARSFQEWIGRVPGAAEQVRDDAMTFLYDTLPFGREIANLGTAGKLLAGVHGEGFPEAASVLARAEDYYRDRPNDELGPGRMWQANRRGWMPPSWIAPLTGELPATIPDVVKYLSEGAMLGKAVGPVLHKIPEWAGRLTGKVVQKAAPHAAPSVQRMPGAYGLMMGEKMAGAQAAPHAARRQMANVAERTAVKQGERAAIQWAEQRAADAAKQMAHQAIEHQVHRGVAHNPATGGQMPKAVPVWNTSGNLPPEVVARIRARLQMEDQW